LNTRSFFDTKWTIPRNDFHLIETECSSLAKTCRGTRFDINGSRDERGHTFLMIAVQNNDLNTARLCFQLGANPDVQCSAGLTAMDFASLHEMAAMIAQNGGATTIDQTWSALDSVSKALHPIDWETQLQFAERAAIPVDTKLSSEETHGRRPRYCPAAC
jgi:hypothetical protein